MLCPCYVSASRRTCYVHSMNVCRDTYIGTTYLNWGRQTNILCSFYECMPRHLYWYNLPELRTTDEHFMFILWMSAETLILVQPELRPAGEHFMFILWMSAETLILVQPELRPADEHFMFILWMSAETLILVQPTWTEAGRRTRLTHLSVRIMKLSGERRRQSQRSEIDLFKMNEAGPANQCVPAASLKQLINAQVIRLVPLGDVWHGPNMGSPTSLRLRLRVAKGIRQVNSTHVGL